MKCIKLLINFIIYLFCFSLFAISETQKCQRQKSGKRSRVYFGDLGVVISAFPFPLYCFVAATNRYNRFASHLPFTDGETRNVNCEEVLTREVKFTTIIQNGG